jgi:tetratricopeptide (TPR) repeat protein
MSLFFLSLVSLAPCAEAQLHSHEGSVSVSGEVTVGVPATGLIAVLSSRGETDRRTDISSNGQFEFPDLPSGQYELTVTNLYGGVIHREYVSLHSNTNPISARLPAQNVGRPASGTVSAVRLRRKVPSKARKEFERGVEAARKNDSAAAIGHLTKATELDPGYMESHNNLGVQHLKADGCEPALAEFQKAIELDPGSPAPQVNLSLALLKMERFAEAETAARKALRLDGGNGNAHYFLGLALFQQRKNISEALDYRQRASETVPHARLAIADISEQRGDVEGAKKELRTYLKSAKPADRESVETRLAALQ